MTVQRAVGRLVLIAATVVGFAAGASAQSGGDEPTLDQRLRSYLMKMPDHTKDPVMPTEAERAQEAPRRSGERPGYIGPLSTETSGGRMGAAGWTTSGSENVGRATSAPHQTGWFGFGFAVEAP